MVICEVPMKSKVSVIGCNCMKVTHICDIGVSHTYGPKAMNTMYLLNMTYPSFRCKVQISRRRSSGRPFKSGSMSFVHYVNLIWVRSVLFGLVESRFKNGRESIFFGQICKSSTADSPVLNRFAWSDECFWYLHHDMMDRSERSWFFDVMRKEKLLCFCYYELLASY